MNYVICLKSRLVVGNDMEAYMFMSAFVHSVALLVDSNVAQHSVGSYRPIIDVTEQLSKMPWKLASILSTTQPILVAEG